MARLFFILSLLIALWAGGRPAWSHAVLLETEPVNGAVLTEAPGDILLLFNETVTPISLTLIGHDGSTPIAAMVHDATVHGTIARKLNDGTYLVSYRVVSADSHPISGSFLFVIGAPSTDAPIAPDTHGAEGTAAFLVIANRILLLCSLFFAAGGVLFATSVLRMDRAASAPLFQPLRVGAMVAIASALTAIVLQGSLLTGMALTDAAAWRDGNILRVGWQSSLGHSVQLISLCLFLVLLSWRSPVPHPQQWIGTIGAMLALIALALSGHAVTAAPRPLAVTAMALHGLTIGFWVGALWPLLRCLDLPAAQAAAIVRRFSKLGVVAVAVLLVTGLILAVLQLGGDIAALITTRYGQLLLLKLALVALLLLLAIYNKSRLTPPLVRGDVGARERLSQAVRLEIAAVILIIAVSTMMSHTPPPRSVAASESMEIHGSHFGHGSAVPQQSANLQSKGYAAMMTLTPARTGRNTLSVTLRNPDGAPFDALEVKGEFSLPSGGIEPLSAPLRHTGTGRYEWTTDALIQPGQWHLNLAVLINDFERLTFECDLLVSGR